MLSSFPYAKLTFIKSKYHYFVFEKFKRGHKVVFKLPASTSILFSTLIHLLLAYFVLYAYTIDFRTTVNAYTLLLLFYNTLLVQMNVKNTK